MVSATSDFARGDGVTVLLALLNLMQVVWLAEISARGRRIRAGDRPRRRTRSTTRTRRSSPEA